MDTRWEKDACGRCLRRPNVHKLRDARHTKGALHNFLLPCHGRRAQPRLGQQRLRDVVA